MSEMSESEDSAHADIEASVADLEGRLADLPGDLGTPFAEVDGPARTSLGTIFEALIDPGRRFVMTYLLVADEPTSTAELLEYVDTATGRADDQDHARKAIATELVDVQLPALEEAGFIDYNRERQIVDATGQAEVLLPFLHLAREYAHWQERAVEE